MDNGHDFNSTGESNCVSHVVNLTDATVQRQSTGPRTARGKGISSRNALKHAFFCKELIRVHLREADHGVFSKLLNRLIKEKSPVGPSETIQVEFMAIRLYQLKQIFRLINVMRGNSPVKSMSELMLAPNPDEDGFLQDLPSPEAFEKVQRLESHILRHFYRAQAELERLQALRLGGKVPPRVHFEVD